MQPSRNRPGGAREPMEHVRRFLAAVLTGIAPTAHLVKVTSDLAEHYTLIVTVADTLPKRLVLSQALVHAAVSNASARDSLEAALRADLRPEAASKGASPGVRSVRRVRKADWE